MTNLKFSKDFLDVREKMNMHIMTIFPVAIEFFKGSNLPSVYKTKQKFFSNLVETTLPVHNSDILENAEKLLKVYRERGKGVSVADFYLAAVLMKYKTSNTYLLTRNFKDFPASIFKREKVFIFETEYDLLTFVLYKFSENGYEKSLENYLKLPNH